MGNNKKIFIFLISYIFLTLISAIEYPTIIPYVNDFGNILTENQEDSLNEVLKQIEENSTVEIVILTVDSTSGEDIINFAARIGEKNGVGKEGLSNGIIIIWSKENENGLAIATGRGIESTLNDAKVGRILRENRHWFDEGEYNNGFQLIISNVSQEIGSGSVLANSEENEGMLWAFFIIAIIIIIFIIAAVSNSSSSSSSSSGGFFGGSFGSGGGSFGGGFGGGSFGGGGARG